MNTTELRESGKSAACALMAKFNDVADEIDSLRTKLDAMTAERNGLRISLNDARSDMAAALSLVADVRAAIGDDGKRMQPELIEYCKAMKRDADEITELAEALKALIDAADTSDDCQYGTLATSFVRNICIAALAKAGAV